jgi:hypothetical protein
MQVLRLVAHKSAVSNIAQDDNRQFTGSGQLQIPAGEVSGDGGRVGEADADAIDAAVGAGQDFEAEAILFDDFAGKGDVAGDLGDEAPEGGGFVVLGKAEGGWIVSCVPRCTVIARIV